nr:MAG TPA: hypothetical protein [Caudoviricetes sp.]
MAVSVTKEVGAGKTLRFRPLRPRPHSIFCTCKMQKRNFV